MNKVILIGRLARDPELKYTASNTAVCQFTVAVDRRFKSDNQPNADFIPVVAWRQTADFVAQYFRKGSMIAVQGSLQTRSYEDNNGNKRTAYDVVADNVSFCGSKAESGMGAPVAAAPATAPAASYSNSTPEDFSQVVDDDDLPF